MSLSKPTSKWETARDIAVLAIGTMLLVLGILATANSYRPRFAGCVSSDELQYCIEGEQKVVQVFLAEWLNRKRQ